MALPQNTFAEVTLDNAVVIWQDYDLLFLKDNTGCMSLSVGSWCQLSDWGGTFTGVLSGVRTSQFSFNEMSDPRSNIVPQWMDMMAGPHEVPAFSITQEDVEEYDCNRVKMTYRDPTFSILDYAGQNIDKIRGKEYQFERSININGLVYLSPTKEIRIIPYFDDVSVNLEDNEPYSYDERWGKIETIIKKPLKKDQWNTLTLPVEINSNYTKIFGYNDYTKLSQVNDYSSRCV